MTSTSAKNNFFPAGFVSNLQQVLSKKNDEEDKEGDQAEDNVESTDPSASTSASDAAEEAIDASKPIVLVTNGDGIDSPGLVYLVEALVREGLYNVHVTAPQSWVIGYPFRFSALLFCCVWFFFSMFCCLFMSV